MAMNMYLVLLIVAKDYVRVSCQTDTFKLDIGLDLGENRHLYSRDVIAHYSPLSVPIFRLIVLLKPYVTTSSLQIML